MNNRFLLIKGEPDLVRDTKTHAVLQINLKAKAAFKAQRVERRKVKEAMSEIDSLKNDMKDIKEMLRRLLERS